MFRKARLVSFVICFTLCLSNSFAQERQGEISVSPLALTYDGYNIQGQYFFEPQISAGLEYYNRKYTYGGITLNTTTWIPFARYYLENKPQSFFGKTGYFMMTLSAKSGGQSASGNFAGPLFGGGYNWLWENGLSIDAGYEVAFVTGEIEFDDGTKVPVQGGVGGIIFRVGYAF